MNPTTPTTALHAWADDHTTQPVRPYTADRWPTVIALLTTAIGALLIAAAPILDHHTEPTPARQPIEQTPAAQMILPGQQQPAIEPPHRAGVPYTATPGSLDPFDALNPVAHPPTTEPPGTLHPTDLGGLLGGGGR